MRKNVASQVIGAQMVSATDGSAFTGAVTCRVTIDGGTQATGSVGSGACTHEGNGYHTYTPSQAETNGDHVAFTFTGTGAIPVTLQVYTSFPQTGDSFARLGAPAGASLAADVATRASQTSVDTIDDLIDTEVAAIFNRIGAPAGASLAADVAAVKAETATILSDTNDIQTRIPAALVGGRIDANVGAISGDGTAADNLEAALDGTGFEEIRRGTAQAGGATTITLDASASATNDYYNGVIVQILSGTGQGQVRQITDYVGATKVATVGAAWATNPSSDSVFVLLPFAEIAGASAPTAAAIRAEIDANSTRLAAIETDTQDIQSRIPTALVGGRIDANVGAISGDATAADNLEAAADGTGYNLGGGSVVAASVTGAVGSVTGNVGGNVQGNVAGSVGSVTGAVGSVTGNVGGNVAGSVASVTGNVGGNVVGSVGSVASNGLSAASLAADAGTEIAAAVRTELTTELGRLDAAVSTRQATLGATQYEAAADALLNRNAQGGSNTGVLVRHKLAGVPNRIVITRTTSTTGTMTIYAEDGTTIIDTLNLTFVADTGAIASVAP